jgi:hypothetical protein
MKSASACALSLLLALPLILFAGKKNERNVTVTEAVWVGNTLLRAGDYKVKWDGNGSVQVSFVQGNKSMATVPAMATGTAAGPHGSASAKIRAISGSSKGPERIVWNDVSFSFEDQGGEFECE